MDVWVGVCVGVCGVCVGGGVCLLSQGSRGHMVCMWCVCVCVWCVCVWCVCVCLLFQGSRGHTYVERH